MSDMAIVKKQNRAKARAIDILKEAKYEIIRSDNEKVCVLASRKAEVRIIRICVDKITAHDIAVIHDLQFPNVSQACRELWCWDGKDFIVQDISVN